MVSSADDGQLLMDENGVSLSTAIALLRSELREAIESGQNDRVRFAVDAVEVELEIAIKVTRKGNGQLGLWKVLSIGGSRETADSATHRLRLALKPRDTLASQDEDTLIGDDY